MLSLTYLLMKLLKGKNWSLFVIPFDTIACLSAIFLPVSKGREKRMGETGAVKNVRVLLQVAISTPSTLNG